MHVTAFPCGVVASVVSLPTQKIGLASVLNTKHYHKQIVCGGLFPYGNHDMVKNKVPCLPTQEKITTLVTSGI